MSPLSARNLARVLGGDARGDQVSAPGPGHAPNDRSLSIRIDPSAPDGFVVHSFAGNDPIVCRDYVREKVGLSAFRPNGQYARPEVIAEYVFQQADGTPYLRVQRTNAKQFWQSHWDGKSWIGGKPKGQKIPYRLPDIAKHKHATLFIVEGEKDADRLVSLGLVATTASEGAGKWTADLNQYFSGRDVCILPDNDDPGIGHAQDIAQNLHGIAAKVRIIRLPGLPPKGDISDWLDQGGTADKLGELCLDTPEFRPAGDDRSPSRLRPLDISDFCALDIKPREMVLGPIIPEKGLVLIYSPRGMGKTRLATGIGLAVSTGTPFLKWNAPKARRVLLIDGEMPAAALQELLNAVVGSTKPAPRMFQVLAADLLEDAGIGNFADPKVQQEINQLVEERQTEVLILDNLSSLTAALRDNEESSWQSMKFWLLALRRRGISVVILHHAGKTGDQRGTSAREDVLDTVLSLRHPSDYRHEEGCRFEVHFTKHRGFYGKDANPFEARQHTTAFGYEWTLCDITDAHQVRVAEMLKDGMSIRDIAEDIGISKSAVHRFKAKIEGSTNASN